MTKYISGVLILAGFAFYFAEIIIHDSITDNGVSWLFYAGHALVIPGILFNPVYSTIKNMIK